MEKLSVARQVGGFMKSRLGTRPFRVTTLLNRDQDVPESHKELWNEKLPEESEAPDNFAQSLAAEEGVEFGGEPARPIDPILSRIAKEGQDKLYHYGPRGVDLTVEGIKTPSTLDDPSAWWKYRTRVAEDIGKPEGKVTREDTLRWLEEIRGPGGSRMMSVLHSPIGGADSREKLDFAKRRQLYEIDYDRALREGVIESSNIVEESPRSHRPVSRRQLVQELRKAKGFEPENRRLVFQGSPHAMLAIKGGTLPGGYISKVGSDKLYHGSPRRLERLVPRYEHGDPRVPDAVFGTPSRPFALAYAGRKWTDRDLAQGVYYDKGTAVPREMYLREMRPGAFEDTYRGKRGYLYTIPSEGFEPPTGAFGRKGSSMELIRQGDVTPTSTEEIEDVYEALKKEPIVKLYDYNPKDPEVRTSIRRSIRRMKKMEPEDAAQYRKWRFEGSPPEIRKIFKEELKKSGAAKMEPARVKKAAAQLKTELLPHQQRVVERMRKQPGLVVAHGTGSGKTLSSIGAIVDLSPNKARVLVPPALQENYKKEINKHVKGNLPVEIDSIQRAVVSGKPPRGDFIVVDEAHRLRNPSRKGYGLISQSDAEKRMFLTASPVYNKPEDIAPLVNLAAGTRVLPEGRQFEERFIKQPSTGFFATINPFAQKNPKVIRGSELGQVLNKWVDYHGGSESGFPKLTEERIDVPMSKDQSTLHAHAWGQLPLTTRIRIERGLPPDKKDLPSLNMFQSQVRQISSSQAKYTKGSSEPTPKIRAAVTNFTRRAGRNPEHKALVYANYLGTLDDYASELSRRNVPYAEFRGDMPKKERDQSVRDLNAGRVKALLVSGAGGEGLDLKGVRQVQVLEPHWNEEKLRQVIGRARRYRSHEHLPEKDRNVHVERYSSYPVGFFGRKRGIEDTLYDLSEQKQRLNEDVLRLMTKQSKDNRPGADFYRAYFNWKKQQRNSPPNDEWLLGPL